MTLPDPTPHDLAVQAENLTGAVDQLNGSVSALRQSHGRLRLVTIGVVVAVALVMTAVAFLWSRDVDRRLTDAELIAETTRENARVTCLSANQARAAQIQLWGYLLAETEEANPDLTAQERRRLDALEAYVARVFAPRDCDNPSSPTPITPTPTR